VSRIFKQCRVGHSHILKYSELIVDNILVQSNNINQYKSTQFKIVSNISQKVLCYLLGLEKNEIDLKIVHLDLKIQYKKIYDNSTHFQNCYKFN